MPEVFISYSRIDKEFGQRLHDLLLRRKLDVWMDSSDIPRGANWWREIKSGIELSDNFVFLISEDSLASPICNFEIEYARTLNKRIVPILVRETDTIKAQVQLGHRKLDDFQLGLLQGRDILNIARDNWQVLSAINWVNATGVADLTTLVEHLLGALDEDADYIHEHTRLLSRAKDWDTRQRLPSLLLRGEDLERADDWLVSSRTKKPQPTALHHAFIDESHRVEDEENARAAEEERRIRVLEQQTRAAAKENDLLAARTVQLRRAALVAAAISILAILVTIAAGIGTIRSNNTAATAQSKQNAAATQAGVAIETKVAAEAFQGTIEAGATEFALRQERAATLAAGGVILPQRTATQGSVQFIATLTQIAAQNQWQVIVDAGYQTTFGVEMVQVPAGCFWMGSIVEPVEQPITEFCFENAFWIDRYEVTNEQFERLGGVAAKDPTWSRANQPRTDITWFEAYQFCTNQRQASLPSEAQWEYAARGVDSMTYPWGNQFIDVNAVYYYNADFTVSDVGADHRPGGASWVGAYDMAGNVWEWTISLKVPYPYVPDDGRETLANNSDLRIFRGGAFHLNDSELRGAKRGWDRPSLTHEGLGFRCARND